MFLFERAAKLWGAHYDTGRMETQRSADGTMSVSIHDFGQPHRAHCLSVLAARSLRLIHFSKKRCEPPITNINCARVH